MSYLPRFDNAPETQAVILKHLIVLNILQSLKAG